MLLRHKESSIIVLDSLVALIFVLYKNGIKFQKFKHFSKIFQTKHVQNCRSCTNSAPVSNVRPPPQREIFFLNLFRETNEGNR